jgi:hypothetical protein
MNSPHMKDSTHMIRRGASLALCSALFTFYPTGSAQEVFDDFNDGNDQGWERFSPLDIVGASSVFTFPEVGEGNKGYRILSPAPPVPDAGPGRSFSFQSPVYEDFYVAVDVLDWVNEVDQAFGFVLRADNIGLGQTTGYVLNYDPQQASGNRGQIHFNSVTGEAAVETIGAADITLQTGHDYRIVVEVAGNTFTGKVYDHLDLTQPVVTYSGVDETYSQGIAGLFNYYRGGEATDSDIGIADSTFDNYYSSAQTPATIAGEAYYGFSGEPYAVALSPSNRSAYQSAADGLHAHILLPAGTTTAAITLTLNGIVRTPQTAQVTEGNLLKVAYQGLEANRVYNAVLELPNNKNVGRTEWTFDTFESDFLASNEVMVIEAEDYNFNGGSYINRPLPSGFKDSGQSVNSGDQAYLDREGIPDVDFFDYSDVAGEEALAIYRAWDPVNTQAGSSETANVAQPGGNDPAVNDTTRKASLDVGLPEYQVTGTRGGEWLNYTREFPEGVYHVYLRAASRATQSIYLDQVSGNTSGTNQSTDRLGAFLMPNMGIKSNYQFVALTGEDGNRIQLNLNGKQTMRLSIGTEDDNRVNNTTSLNYLLFVPATEEEVPQEATLDIAGSSTVNGDYTAVEGAIFEPGKITVPATASMQFFKILVPASSAGTFSIDSISVQGDTLTITYTP